MKILYEAADGKIFNNQDDCAAYEEHQILYLYNNGEPTSYAQAIYAYIPDTHALTLFRETIIHNNDILTYMATIPGLYCARPCTFGNKKKWNLVAKDEVIRTILATIDTYNYF